MTVAFKSLTILFADENTLLGAIRDIDRVVVFMKAATSKNRTDPMLRKQLQSRGIQV